MQFHQHPAVFFGMNRNIIIAVSVVVFHVAALWALQLGLLRRVVEVFVPAEVLSEFIEPPAPKVVPLPPLQPQPVPLKPPITLAAPLPSQTTAPQPLTVADPTPSPNTLIVTPAPSSPATLSNATPTPMVPSTPVRLELPSSEANYLQNAKPPYPRLSKRLGEQGKVVLRVLIGVDGSAQQAEIKQSSGFDRLDQAALTTVLRWRYVPGKRAGTPETMWFNVPINFVLE